MKKTSTPDIGTTMYFVDEHFYRIDGFAAPVKEYCVCSGKVIGSIKVGYTEIVLRGESPDGYMTLNYFKVDEIGTKVFYTPIEAALYAKSLTERFEFAWKWLGPPEFPLRRPWANYLSEQEEAI